MQSHLWLHAPPWPKHGYPISMLDDIREQRGRWHSGFGESRFTSGSVEQGQYRPRL
jgi:hypothetical protein